MKLRKYYSRWQWQTIAAVIMLALFAGTYSELFLEARTFINTGIDVGLRNGQWSSALPKVVALTIIYAAGLALLVSFMPEILHWGDHYRYPIAVVLLIVLVICKISGSSVAYWKSYLADDSVEGGVLFGISRLIRSDEWACLTPFCFSQVAVGFDAISQSMRGIPTDVTTVYGGPAFAVVTLFRPFLWGYLVLGAERGLSFFWCGRIIALFLASFECAKVYTNQNKYISLTAAVMITFSSTVQWWFSVNGFVEMLIFGQILLVLISKYMSGSSIRQKVLCAAGMVECVGGVLFTYYPAQEIPWIYMIAVMGILLIVSNWSRFQFSPKQDCLILGSAVVVLIILVSAVVLFSLDTYKAIMGTVYPGNRFSTGGGVSLLDLTGFLQSLFLPLEDRDLAQNVCESSLIVSFFPLGTLAAAYMGVKKKDLLSMGMLILQVVFVLFCVIGMPEWLAKVTLFSYVTSSRLLPIVSILELMMLFRAVSLSEQLHSRKSVLLIIVLSAVYVGCAVLRQKNYMGRIAILLALIASFWILYGLVNQRRDWGRTIMLISATITIALSGLAVNPVQKGADALLNNKLLSTVRELKNQNPEAKWALTEAGFPMGNLLIVAGVPAVGSTNVYPAMELWGKLDPDGVYEDVYNRYSHIQINLSEDDTTFTLLQDDCFVLDLSYLDIEKLGLNYIVSLSDYSDKPLVASCLTEVDYASGYHIYQVK